MFGRAIFPLGAQKVVAVPPAALTGARPAAIGIRGGRWRSAHPAGHHGTAHRRCGGSSVRPDRRRKGRAARARGLAGRRPGRGPAMSEPRRLGPAGRFAHAWISSKLTPLLICARAAHRRVRRVETAARRRAADHRADDRRVRADARRLGARGGRARHQADGETALGDPGRRVHLLHFQPGHVDGDRALLRGPGRREEHRPPEPEAARQFRPDPAGRFAAPGEAALHRRRADSRAHALQPPLQRFRIAAHRRPTRRHHQTGARCFRRHPDGRAAARSAHRAGSGQTGGLSDVALAGGRSAGSFQSPSALGQVRLGKSRIPAGNRRVPAHFRRRAQRRGGSRRRQAGVPAQRGGSRRWRRRAHRVRSHGERGVEGIPARGDHFHRQAQGHERRGSRRQRAAPHRAAEGRR